MSKHLRIAFVTIIAGLFVIPATLSAALAQQEPIAGGYAETSNSDPEALAAGRFAVRREAQKTHRRMTFRAIKRAEVQVVAGLNYRLCLSVRIGRRTREVTVVVYKNLQQKYSLTNWTAGCVTQ